MTMKNSIKFIITLSLLVCLPTLVLAQDSLVVLPLEASRLEPYHLQVTYNKTTHLLFPSPIRYVDLGSDLLAASKAESVANILRIKSAVQHFEEETNFSVITQDGKFYSFNVMYSPFPDILNYNLAQLQSRPKKISGDVLFEDLRGGSSSFTELLMKRVYANNERKIRHINSKSYGILFSLKGLYVQDSKFYFVIDIKNRSQLSYKVETVSFTITDKKNLKRTVVQDRVISPLRIYPEIENIGPQSQQRFVFLLDQFTLLGDQILEIELFENNGGRYQKLKLDNWELINARTLDQINLKLN